MAELRLISNRTKQLKPLAEAALQNELRLLVAGVMRTEQNLIEFEKRFQRTTQEFIDQYEKDQMEETLDFAEWVGEHRMLERLRQKAEALRDVRFAN